MSATSHGDANGDGDTDGADFLEWQWQLGTGLPGFAGGKGAVPEPAGAIVVMALLAVAPVRRTSARRPR
jgi:hypothetical protein